MKRTVRADLPTPPALSPIQFPEVAKRRKGELTAEDNRVEFTHQDTKRRKEECGRVIRLPDRRGGGEEKGAKWNTVFDAHHLL